MTAAPYAGRYSQHQRELLVAGFLDCDLATLQGAGLAWLTDAEAGARGVAGVPGVEQLLVQAIGALEEQDADPAVVNVDAARSYVQAIASTCDASLHAALELALGRDPLAPPTDPRTENL